jgi:hypothetical protein
MVIDGRLANPFSAKARDPRGHHLRDQTDRCSGRINSGSEEGVELSAGDDGRKEMAN